MQQRESGTCVVKLVHNSQAACPYFMVEIGNGGNKLCQLLQRIRIGAWSTVSLQGETGNVTCMGLGVFDPGI